MIKFKDIFRGKHTDIYSFPKSRRDLIKIRTEIFNFENLRWPRVDAGSLDLYLKDKKGLTYFFEKE